MTCQYRAYGNTSYAHTPWLPPGHILGRVTLLWLVTTRLASARVLSRHAVFTVCTDTLDVLLLVCLSVCLSVYVGVCLCSSVRLSVCVVFVSVGCLCLCVLCCVCVVSGIGWCVWVCCAGVEGNEHGLVAHVEGLCAKEIFDRGSWEHSL